MTSEIQDCDNDHCQGIIIDHFFTKRLEYIMNFSFPKSSDAGITQIIW